MATIHWLLDLHISIQSVPITTIIVMSDEVYMA
jgi:hypothetical protein